MPRVRDLLYRFRPAGAPGPASAAAVPADRAADRAAELAPVLALLDETEERCAALRAEADRDAEARRGRALETARAVVADAESRVGSERAEAAAAVAGAAAEESATTLRSAEAEAERLLARAAVRTPAFVAEVVASVEGLLAPAGEERSP